MSPKPTFKYRPNATARPTSRRQAVALDRKLGRHVSSDEQHQHERLIGEINRAFDSRRDA